MFNSLSDIILYVATFCAAGLISAASMPSVFTLARVFGAYDIPHSRHMHKKPTPLLGGIAIYLGFVIASLTAYLISFGFVPETLKTVIIGGLFIIILGAVDDAVGLSPIAKLCGQTSVAVCTSLFGSSITQIELFGTYISLRNFSLPITVLWIIVMINAINLIDGLDGLACGSSAICSVSLFAVALSTAQPDLAILALAIGGACIGFLPFNLSPAKAFMGDTGAMFLGYAFSVISISGLFKMHTVISFLTPIIIFGIPLFDTVFTFFRRLFRGKNPFIGDRGHFHYRLVDLGVSTKSTVGMFYIVTAILGVAAILFTYSPALALIIAALAFVFFAIVSYICRSRAAASSAADKTAETPRKQRRNI